MFGFLFLFLFSYLIQYVQWEKVATHHSSSVKCKWSPEIESALRVPRVSPTDSSVTVNAEDGVQLPHDLPYAYDIFLLSALS